MRHAPEAQLCLDLGHARQVDPSMTVTFLLTDEHRTALLEASLESLPDGYNWDDEMAPWLLDAASAPVITSWLDIISIHRGKAVGRVTFRATPNSMDSTLRRALLPAPDPETPAPPR